MQFETHTHTRRYITFRHSGLLRTTVPVDLIEAVREMPNGDSEITLRSGRILRTDGPASFDQITNAIAPNHET